MEYNPTCSISTGTKANLMPGRNNDSLFGMHFFLTPSSKILIPGEQKVSVVLHLIKSPALSLLPYQIYQQKLRKQPAMLDCLAEG